MNSMKSWFWKTAAALAALAILVMVTPRAVRSAAAALVQVTNTASSPAVTQPVHAMASQLVTLQVSGATSGLLPYGSPSSLVQYFPATGSRSSSPYVVPAGQNLVITDINYLASAAGTIYFYNNVSGDGYGAEQFYAPAASSQLFHLTSGLVYPSGAYVTVVQGQNTLSSVIVHGYLTAN